jgi:predicted DNA-binding protein (MmcQ/YjbR family)
MPRWIEMETINWLDFGRILAGFWLDKIERMLDDRMVIKKGKVMNIEDVREYALMLAGANEDMPYGPDWLIFRIEGKIFLHIWLESPEPTCAVKLEPEFGLSLREHYEGVRPAYHLNKTHWNDIYLDRIDDELTKQWIRQSYELVLSKLPKKLREKYL